MEVITFSQVDEKQYSDFVTAHGGSFLQSWGWGEFQTSLGKTAVRFGLHDNGQLVGVVQFLQTKVPHLPGFYLYAPYGPVLSESNKDRVMLNLETHIKKHFPGAWFIRIEPPMNLPVAARATLRIQPGKTLVTDLTQTEEELLAAMHQKTRYNIKVAAKHDVKVESELLITPQHGLHTAEFVQLILETSSRQKYHNYPASYYGDLINFFGLHHTNTDCQIQLYKALVGNELVASAIMIDHGNTRTYLFGGSSDRHRSVMAPYALHWQAMKDAKNRGLTKYDWWGVETSSGAMPGFVQFKLRWGGQQIVYPPAIDIIQNRAWYTIYNVLRRLNRIF